MGDHVRMHRRLPVLLAVAIASLPAACGKDEQREARTTSAAPSVRVEVWKPPAQRHRGPRGKSACRAVRTSDVRPLLAAAGADAARITREKRDSYDLSDCRFTTRDAATWVTIDRAVDAAKRYWYRMTEQQQNHAPDAQRRPSLVKGIGQDRTYGGAGAFWTPALNRLIAFRDRTMIIVGFTVQGSTDAERRRGAIRLAKLTFRRLFGGRPPGRVERIVTAPHP
jgi:hypothetical protein